MRSCQRYNSNTWLDLWKALSKETTTRLPFQHPSCSMTTSLFVQILFSVCLPSSETSRSFVASITYVADITRFPAVSNLPASIAASHREGWQKKKNTKREKKKGKEVLDCPLKKIKSNPQIHKQQRKPFTISSPPSSAEVRGSNCCSTLYLIPKI